MNLLPKRKTRTELLLKSLNEDKELDKPVNLKVNIKPTTTEEIELEENLEEIPSNNKDILDEDILDSKFNSEIKLKPDQQKRSLFGKLFFNKTAKITGKPTEDTGFDRVGLGGKKTKQHKRPKQHKKTKKHKSRKNKTKRRRRF